MPIAEDVIQALEEAEYFYEQMQKTKQSKDFRSNLSGFLSRARSITWILKKHHSIDSKFKEWYAKKSREMQNDELMAFFKHARNVSEKERPTGMKSSTHIRHIEADIKEFGHDGVAITGKGDLVWLHKDKDGKMKEIPMREFNNEVYREFYFTDPPPPPLFQHVQVVDLCGLYLIALKKLIEEATHLLGSEDKS